MTDKHGIGERGIKFRAWDKEREMIGYFDLSDGCASIEYCEPYFAGFNTWFPTSGDGLFKFYYENENKNQVLMQYTGLKDKKGKEIYEGDIIKIHEVSTFCPSDSGKKMETMKGSIHVVRVYMEDSMCLVEGGGYSAHLITAYSNANERDDCGIFVIGNVFENPNLLTKF